MVWFFLAVQTLFSLALLYTLGKLVVMQEEQDDCLDEHDERLDALEDYADYVRSEIFEIKKHNAKGRENTENDEWSNVRVKWRRRTGRVNAGHRNWSKV